MKHVHTCIAGEVKPNDLAILLFLSPATITAILVDRLLDAFMAVMLSQLRSYLQHVLTEIFYLSMLWGSKFCSFKAELHKKHVCLSGQNLDGGSAGTTSERLFY